MGSYWNVAVVGVGRLGRAILSYPGFTPDGFRLVAALARAGRLVQEMDQNQGSSVGQVVGHGLQGEDRVDVADSHSFPYLRGYRSVVQDGPDSRRH